MRLALLVLATVLACDAGEQKPVQRRRDDSAVRQEQLAAVLADDPTRNRVEADELFCATDDDCAVVSGIDCSRCCAIAAIAKRHVEAYHVRTQQNCAGYHGPSCQCVVNPRNVPACRQHLCILLTSDEAGHSRS